MDEGLPDPRGLNTTELLEIIRCQTGLVVRRSVPKERLVQIVEQGGMPTQEELAGTNESRRLLQVFIEKNWVQINSQLPCKGTNRGRCTIYPCPEGRHLDCFGASREHLHLFIGGAA